MLINLHMVDDEGLRIITNPKNSNLNMQLTRHNRDSLEYTGCPILNNPAQ